MIRAPLSTTSILDESTDVVRLTAAPWAAVVILTAIPYRFMQAFFVDRLFALGSDALQHGNLLRSTANITIATFVLYTWGRAVYARACRLGAARGATPGSETWRVPVPALACFLFTAAFAEVLFYATSLTVFGLGLTAIFSGLAVGTMELNERASMSGALGLIRRYGREVRLVAALVLVFFCALVVALVNVGAAFGIGYWLASPLLGTDLTAWDARFGFGNRRLWLSVIAGALIAIEPFWIAANVTLVQKAGAEENGEDLRAWFEELRRA